MSAKMRSFRFSAWTHRRGHYDDTEIPRGEYIEPDLCIELNGACVVPADPQWWDGETDEPDWSHGAYLAHPQTGRMIPGTNMEGRPMDVMIEAWRSGRRTMDGVLIFSASPGRKKR